MRFSLAFSLFLFAPAALSAQEHYHNPQPEPETAEPAAGAPTGFASGTSWEPASTPMHMWHRELGDWDLGVHGQLVFGLNGSTSSRIGNHFDSQNWVMLMGGRKLGRGNLLLRGMASLEPFTFRAGGSPQLFQTGETFEGRPIVDAQHPHDLFMELSATYVLPLGRRARWFGYVGVPGEPAIGPVAFMHRPSSSLNPWAPLSHHLQDSTHIAFGVFTSGLVYRRLKIEGSYFNGREPDEERLDFDFRPWHGSQAVRAAFAPGRNWTMEGSVAWLREPEALEPGDIRRTTISAMYNRPFDRGNWAAALIWGRNREEHHEPAVTLDGFVLESTLVLRDQNYLYTRLEAVDKTDILLARDEDDHQDSEPDAERLLRIGAFTFGAGRDLWSGGGWAIGIGGDLTIYTKPGVLDPVHGERPVSYRLYLRLRPVSAQAGMHAHDGT